MNVSGFITIASVIDIILKNWEISLVAVVVFVCLFVALFKGIKRGLKLLFWVLLAACIVIAIVFAALTALDKPAEFISFAVSWVPTILFALTILFSTLLGAKRGLRKSMILLVHAVCAGGLCIGLYFFCISSKAVDGWLLDVVDFFMGGKGALQSRLGVSGDATTLRGVFAEYVPSLFGYGSEIQILLSGNGAYVMTLVDLAYRTAFATVLYVVYLLLVFILYIVYHIFYSERKYRRKKNLAFAQNQTDSSYKKRRIGGGVVGFVRGLVVGLISLSFMGSAFFIASGGTGDGELADYKFGNKDADFAYSVYRSIESYGTHGIFKVLNTFKDPDDMPYYLFAADLILSGGLDDEKNGIDENVKFREELGAYVGFARETMELLMKYGEEDLTPVINGESSENAMNVVLNVMKKQDFRLEFENLVDNFDSQTYVINFSLALVNSVIENIDDMSFMSSVSSDNKELLKVLFQEGYLSEVIPDERELRNKLDSSVASGGEIRPCFNLNHLLTKRDAQVVLHVVLSFLSGDISTGNTLSLVKQILPEIEKLSIFGTKRAEEMEPILGRMYCFVENKYLTEAGADGITYKEIRKENISWGEEIRSLVSVTEDLLTIYDNVNVEGTTTAQKVRAVFDAQNEHYKKNIALYDGVCERVENSVLLGKVLSSGLIMKNITSTLNSVGKDVYVPKKIEFENKYNQAGELISLGETAQIFYGLRLLGESQNQNLMDAVFNSFSEMELSDILNLLEESFAVKDKLDRTLADYFTDSVLLRSTLSSILIDRSEDTLVIPLSARERDLFGMPVNLIRQEEMKSLFGNLPRLNSLISALSGEEVGTSETVTELVAVCDLFDVSDIISASAVNSIVQDENVVSALEISPAYLWAGSKSELEKYNEKNIWKKELPALVTALDEIFGVSTGEPFTINRSNLSEKLFGVLKTVNGESSVLPEKTRLEVCYASEIILGDLTAQLDKAVEEDVDATVISAAKEGKYYQYNELSHLSEAINQLTLNSFDELEEFDSTFEVKSLSEPSETDEELTRLDVMYQSLIAAGLITSNIQDSMASGNGVLVDNAKAYRADVKVYKQSEIEALLALLGEQEVENYEMGTVSELRPYLEPDGENEPKSYLVSAMVSKNILDRSDVTVPESIVSEQLIAPKELVRLLDAFSALNDHDRLDQWNVSANMVLPAPENREVVLDSLIMRATMTKVIVNNSSSVILLENHFAQESICREQMNAFFNVLDVIGSSELKIPAFKSLEEIAHFRDRLETFYEFDATRYQIGNLLYDRTENAWEEEVCVLEKGEKVTANGTTAWSVSYETAEEILASYGEAEEVEP